MLTSKQRAILRGKANTMDPVFIVGKGEIDETMIQGVKDCLDARELIKLKVLENSIVCHNSIYIFKFRININRC